MRDVEMRGELRSEPCGGLEWRELQPVVTGEGLGSPGSLA